MLVTGASGFLGGALVRRLASEGYRVKVLVRPTSDLSSLEGCSIEPVVGGLTDAEAVASALREVSVVYHCAAVSTDWAPTKDFREANVMGVQTLVEAACAQEGLRRFVHVSTTDVYGYPRLACDESGPRLAVGLPYNETKILGEEVVWEAGRRGLPITIVRPASIYGPRSAEFVREIGQLLRQGMMLTLDGGESHAGLIYVDNCVEAMVQLASSPSAEGRAFNLRDPHDTSWRGYLDALAAAIGSGRARLNLPGGMAYGLGWLLEVLYGLLRVRSRPLLTRHAVRVLQRDQGYVIDVMKAEVDCAAFIDLEEGIRRSAEWFLEVEGRT